MSAGQPHVAVLMGGWSPERDVSLVSGRDCADALRDQGYRVSELDVDRDVAARLADLKPDVVFNALHGRWGEDGCIQGLLEILGIPYTHSGVRASAMAMDKAVAKRVFVEAGIRCAEGLVVERKSAARQHVMDPPYVVKPVNQGSSVGVLIVSESENRPPAELASDDWAFGEAVMVEKYVPGRELTAAVMGEQVLGVSEIVANVGRFYSYQAKYDDGGSTHLVPAPIHENAYKEACEAAKRAHGSLGCRGVSRADMRYDDTRGEPGDVYLLELNTQPGMTPVSLVPELARLQGMSFGDLVRWMVEDASCDR